MHDVEDGVRSVGDNAVGDEVDGSFVEVSLVGGVGEERGERGGGRSLRYVLGNVPPWGKEFSDLKW